VKSDYFRVGETRKQFQGGFRWGVGGPFGNAEDAIGKHFASWRRFAGWRVCELAGFQP
jgi:hypothetical protein